MFVRKLAPPNRRVKSRAIMIRFNGKNAVAAGQVLSVSGGLTVSG